MNTETLDLSKLSRKELAAEIVRRDKEEKEIIAAERNKLEQDRNDFVKHTISKFIAQQKELEQLKEFTIKEANNLDARMWEMHDKERKERKQFTIKNEEDSEKIVVEYQERMEFTDEADVFITEIKDIMREKFAARNKGLYNILEGLLMKGRNQEFDPKLLAKAKRQVRELGDDNLIAKFDALDECQRVVGTSLYCRAYKRDENRKWQDISLNFSSL